MKRVLISCVNQPYREKVVSYLAKECNLIVVDPDKMLIPYDFENIILTRSPLDYIVSYFMKPPDPPDFEKEINKALKLYSGFSHHVMITAVASGAEDYPSWAADAIYERGVKTLLIPFRNVKQSIVIEPNWEKQMFGIRSFLMGLVITNGKK